MSMNQTAIDLVQVIVGSFPFIMIISIIVFFVMDCRQRESSSSIEVSLTEEDAESEDQEPEPEIKESRTCSYCGKELLFDETVCSYCGAPRKT